MLKSRLSSSRSWTS